MNPITGAARTPYVSGGIPKLRENAPANETPADEPRPRRTDAYVPGRTDPLEKSESATYNTDRVDEELRRLERERQQIAQQLQAERDPRRAETLRKKLEQVDNELRQKDNDGYRRRMAVRA